MTSICPWCNQKVYFAERQVAEGKDYHGACLQKKKAQDKPKLLGVYPGEDPSRVAGQMRAPGGIDIQPPKPAAQKGTCPQCEKPNPPTAKFCAECGGQLVQ
eukprot:m51a1_g4754 hypothetical protein (101) ;mRNA; f:416016-416765